MPLSRFARLPEEKRTHLLEIAMKEFARKGFETASLNSILAAAGLGKSSYYYYFEDKEDLYVTCVLDAGGRLLQEAPLLRSESLTAKDFWESIGSWFDSLISIGARHPLPMALFRDVPSMRRVLGPRMEVLAKQMTAPAVKIIRRGQQIGCVRTDLDAERLCLVGFAADAALDEALLARLPEVTPAELKKHGRLVLDMWQRILAPEGSPKRRRATK
jgi:AcrR family transcriptional regulator